MYIKPYFCIKNLYDWQKNPASALFLDSELQWNCPGKAHMSNLSSPREIISEKVSTDAYVTFAYSEDLGTIRK